MEFVCECRKFNKGFSHQKNFGLMLAFLVLKHYLVQNFYIIQPRSKMGDLVDKISFTMKPSVGPGQVQGDKISFTMEPRVGPGQVQGDKISFTMEPRVGPGQVQGDKIYPEACQSGLWAFFLHRKCQSLILGLVKERMRGAGETHRGGRYGRELNSNQIQLK